MDLSAVKTKRDVTSPIGCRYFNAYFCIKPQLCCSILKQISPIPRNLRNVNKALLKPVWELSLCLGKGYLRFYYFIIIPPSGVSPPPEICLSSVLFNLLVFRFNFVSSMLLLVLVKSFISIRFNSYSVCAFINKYHSSANCHRF